MSLRIVLVALGLQFVLSKGEDHHNEREVQNGLPKQSMPFSGAPASPTFSMPQFEFGPSRVSTGDAGSPYTPTSEYDHLFNPRELISYNLQFEDGEWERINIDPAAEEYGRCSVTVQYGTELAHTFASSSMGCKFKGSAGSLQMCLDLHGNKIPSCRKLSLKVHANAFGKKGKDRVYGLEKLVFNGAAVDYSLMAERVAYAGLNDLGVISPRAVHAKVFINGRYSGVYVFVEEVDEAFTARHFAQDFNAGEGGLYKDLWLNDVSLEKTKKKRKSGKKETEFFDSLHADLNAAQDQDAVQFINKYIDVDSFADVTAYNSLIGMTDDWRMRHNFFFYVRQDESGKKLVMIPWDYDRLNDPNAKTRGANGGEPWHAILPLSSPRCTAPLLTSSQMAARQAQNSQEFAFWQSVFEELPEDVNIPIMCDKITRLLKIAIEDQVHLRVKELATARNWDHLRSSLNRWASQINQAIQKVGKWVGFPCSLSRIYCLVSTTSQTPSIRYTDSMAF